MPSRWPIFRKLLLWGALFLITLGTLSVSGLSGVHAYRGLARGISRRAREIPYANSLAPSIGEMRVILADVKESLKYPSVYRSNAANRQLQRTDFRDKLGEFNRNLERYRDALEENGFSDPHIGDNRDELEAVAKMHTIADGIQDIHLNQLWMLDEFHGQHEIHDQLEKKLQDLHDLSTSLPGYLHNRMSKFAGEVRTQYRSMIILAWGTSLTSFALLALLARLFWCWVLRPLRTLIDGSRLVASGRFDHRITLDSEDEMAELAEAMNAMTRNFQAIRDDLDQQVRQRTKEVVRGEQMAGVGFLAAGVAHEINNPLASIALCAESLEQRVQDIIRYDDGLSDSEHNHEIDVLKNYLRMIQDEAFRCKQITERLLDFARIGDVERHHTDLGELVEGVIDMVGHLGKYKRKTILYEGSPSVIAEINAQEIKQVVLNLLTNALDSLDCGGAVTIRLEKSGASARLSVEDDGCGMTPDVQRHLFEPFYTRKRGGQGTGLGLSISYRIVFDHGGKIQASSAGRGMGSQLVVTLPLSTQNQERDHHVQAA